MSKIYSKEIEVSFRNETYRVRDDGSVFRHKRVGKRARPYDCNWLFGNESDSHPYLTIAGERVHQIVATAFHGDSPGPEYVVDHIDTNCRNNRPENLRWVTRLENALKNPITRKKIEYYCGSIESFLDNPSQMNELSNGVSFNWMRSVTKEEAQNCKERMLIWASSDHTLSRENSTRPIEEWIFKPARNIQGPEEDSVLTKSLTPHAYQKNWRVPSSFPCCPRKISNKPLEDYYQNLNAGEVFSFNDKYPESFIVERAYAQNKQSILVLCTREGIKPWVMAEIQFDGENFTHFNLGSFFTQNGADKQFCIKQGKEWLGSDSMDEFC